MLVERDAHRVGAPAADREDGALVDRDRGDAEIFGAHVFGAAHVRSVQLHGSSGGVDEQIPFDMERRQRGRGADGLGRRRERGEDHTQGHREPREEAFHTCKTACLRQDIGVGVTRAEHLDAGLRRRGGGD